MIEFVFTPDDARTTATHVIEHFRREKYKVNIEPAIDDEVRFRPTLEAASKDLRILVEAQSDPQYSEGLKELMHWAVVNQIYSEIYIATGPEVNFKPRFLASTKKEGIGLLMINDSGQVECYQRARNPALVVALNPTFKLSNLKGEIKAEIQRFNEGDRKAALQQMCEIVERETDRLAMRAARASWINKNKDTISSMKWANQIDVLASTKNYQRNRTPLLSSALAGDLHSFRDARNLVDHKARTKKEEREREKQFVERMVAGPRLVDELLRAKNKVK